VLARLIGERMSKSLGQQVVIDNRTGAGSRLGIEIAAKAAADGYTLLLADMPHTIIPAFQKGVHYDPVRDFTPIGLIGTASMVFFVNPAVKAEAIRDFVTLAKADPEKKSPSPRAESEVPPTSRRSCFRPRPASSSCMCRFAAPARP
jgi:tripartite-type tricarboxylate transporter receptor subunit TctC